MMKIFLLSCFLVLEILQGKADLQISPQTVAYVKENKSVTLTCIATDLTFNLFSWKNVNDGHTYEIISATCQPFSSINATAYQFTCSGNTFTWTIQQVTRQQHGDGWTCATNDQNDESSGRTNIFVTVPVTSVTFASPVSNSFTVKESVQRDYVCTTSEERPRSTIKWYITGNAVPLGTGTNTQTENDTLTQTTSRFSFSFNRNSSGEQLFCTALNINGQTPVVSRKKNLIVEYGTDGPQVIEGFISGATYKAILFKEQNLVCYITGGNPAPTLTWDCFNGTPETEKGGSDEVRKSIKWTPNSNRSSTCKCKSYQTVSGERVSTLYVVVLYPPSTPELSVNGTIVTGTVKVIRDRNVVVKCETTSSPGSTYEWSTNVNIQNLRLSTVSLSDEKSYTCTVTNTMVPSQGNIKTTSAYTNFTLDVLFPPITPILKVEEQQILGNLSVVKGDNIRVTCESDSDPGPPSYKWSGQSLGSAVLTISNIQSAATKTCTATNTMSPTAAAEETKGNSSATLSIIVMRGPTTPIVSYRSSDGQNTQLTNEQLLVIKGTDFSLVCSGSNSIPAPTYRWSGKKTSNTNTISYVNIGTNDYGQSTCYVENTMVRTVGNTSYGNNSIYVVIEILTKPEVELFQFQTVVENQPLTVPCTASGNPDPTNYTWTRSRDNFRQTQSTINIPNTSRDDTDVYTCTARNTMLPTVGSRTIGVGTRTMDVKILYHPDVTVSALNDTTLTETATNVILLCSAKGEPHEYNFSKWIQYAPDGLTKVKEYDSTRIEGGNAFLTFTSLSYMDSGIYHCFVRNGIEDYRTGNITATNSTLQTVTGKPVITDGKHDIAAAKHENSTLWVDFYTNDGSGPSVQWYKINVDSKYNLSNKEGKMLLETVPEDVSVNYHTVQVLQQGNRTQLLIQNISDSDFGEYEVEIQNSIGNTTWKINLVAQGAPDLPSKFRDISATETSIVLSWKSGFHGGANQTFYIQYKTSSSKWQNRTEIIGGLMTDTDFNTTVDNLKSGTVHSFRIFAANEYGRSSFSVPIDALTSKSEELHDGGDSITGPAIGGGVGSALVIVAIVFLVVIIRKRRQGGGEAGTQKKILLDGNRSKNGVKKNDDLEEVPNPMYEPAGAFQSSLNTTQNAGIKNLETTDLYATPMKTKGGKKESPGDLYSVPDKSRGGKKESPGDLYSVPDKNRGKKKEPQTDIYSFPQKGKGKQKHQKKQKEKKQKQKKGKDNLQGNVNEGLVYENADLGAGAGVIDTENVYEMTDASEPPKTSRTPNADGLIYLEVDVSRNKDATSNGKVVIHGLDDRSDYADIAFGKVGEQAPESDEEKAKENTNEG